MVGSDGSDGSDGFDGWLASTGSDGDDGADRFVDESPKLLRSWDAATIGVTERMGVHELATPRETARSRSLRRVHKIDGERAEETADSDSAD